MHPLGQGGSHFGAKKTLLQMYLTFPVTSATSEHTFSALRWLKNYLRSTMMEGWTTAYRCIVTNRLWTHQTLWRLDRGLLVPTKVGKGILKNWVGVCTWLSENLQIDRLFFAFYRMHATNYLVSLMIFLCQGHRMQR